MTQNLPVSSQPSVPHQTGERRTDGVLVSRAIAFVVDVCIVAMLSLVASVGVGFLGVVTAGFAWLLFPVVGIAVAMAYAALTIGGPRQATLGMRVTGVRVEPASGGAPDGITAAAHALLFYVAAYTIGLFILNILIGVFRGDSRMGHDLATGLVVVRN